jgi:hypothetical protein
MITLTKNELKKIIAGKADSGTCSTSCSVWNSKTNSMESKTCGYVAGVGNLPGFCSCPEGNGACN